MQYLGPEPGERGQIVGIDDEVVQRDGHDGQCARPSRAPPSVLSDTGEEELPDVLGEQFRYLRRGEVAAALELRPVPDAPPARACAANRIPATAAATSSA
ncbi:hypothetical protein Saso_21360 [Streptomyces asoensis]|uniref:Uncharacterized protein n=1 Tax=Streptomyces asoensis TaxID=249586 RepID=A0ABQ3RX95_9ACTN|nr:hypothetical protein GCM10010496_13950 [Streptomyces asoensis]GHI60486.1 hypothetical protein Saso_21360 [Streptomyces asoensis]